MWALTSSLPFYTLLQPRSCRHIAPGRTPQQCCGPRRPFPNKSGATSHSRRGRDEYKADANKGPLEGRIAGADWRNARQPMTILSCAICCHRRGHCGERVAGTTRRDFAQSLARSRLNPILPNERRRGPGRAGFNTTINYLNVRTYSAHNPDSVAVDVNVLGRGRAWRRRWACSQCLSFALELLCGFRGSRS